MSNASSSILAEEPRTIKAKRTLCGIASRVVKAKLTVPRIDARSTERRAIAGLAESARDAKIVLFRAPSGFGKTTAMCQLFKLLEVQGRSVGWLTLDAADDDFRRLLVHLVAVFETLLVNEGGVAVQSYGNAMDVDRLAFELFDRIERSDKPFTLFIDDYEAVAARPIDALLSLILDRLPNRGQVVIASRRMPAVQVGRLRAQGELVEVEQLQLRFTRQEAAIFLKERHGLSLPDRDVSLLYAATEGWPIALSLASTVLCSRPNPQAFISTFSGSDTAVAEYLAAEVLAQLPADLQQFLLRTSILTELTPDLCNAVCRRDDSHDLLRQLEQSIGGVILVDLERQAFRYHHLFAGFLRARLGQESAGELAQLHARASQWFSTVGRPVPAIEHAFAGGCIESALSMLSEHVRSFLFEGRFRLVARWLGNLAENERSASPFLRTAYVWSLTFTSRGAEALQQLDMLESQVTGDGEHAALDTRQELPALRSLIYGVLDRNDEAFSLAEEALKLPLRPDSFAYHLLAMTAATGRMAAARHEDAIDLLGRIEPSNELGISRAAISIVYATCVEGLVDLRQGRVRQAIAQFRLNFNEITATYGCRSLGKAIVAVYLAEALYEVDELQEAEQILALYMPVVLEVALPDLLIVAHLVRSRIAFARGDSDQAFRWLSELEFIGRQGRLPRAVAAAQFERVRLALHRNNLSEAQSEFQRTEASLDRMEKSGVVMPANDVETVELARYRLAAHGVECKHALVQLKADMRTAEGLGRNRRALKYKIILACALQANGLARQALRTMHEALEAAYAQGLVRVFLDEGSPVIGLVREVCKTRPQVPACEGEHSLTQFIHHLLRCAGVCPDSSSMPSTGMEGSTALSERELRVLASVAQGLSNAAIAASMFVAETTVRAHLRRINVKLGARNRTQAVAAARQLGALG